MSNKYDPFKHLLKSLNHPISVIGLTETWLTDTNKENFQLDDYNYVNANRTHKNGEGVGIYVTKNLQFKTRDDLTTTQKEIAESIFIELMTQI